MSFDIVENFIVIVISVALLLFAIAFPIVMVWSFIRSIRIKRLVPRLLLSTIPLVLMIPYVRVVYAVAPLGDKFVTSTTSPNGTEMVVFQRCNYSAEPYHTHFYFRELDKNWRSFQIDFEDTRWFTGRIDLDPDDNLVTIFRGSRVIANFDLTTHEFTMNDFTQSATHVHADARNSPWAK